MDKSQFQLIQSPQELTTEQVTKPHCKPKKPNLTNQQRQRIYELLLEGSRNGKLPYGIKGSVGRQFNVSARTVGTIWRQGRKSLAEGEGCANVTSKISTQSGRKKKEVDLSFIENVPMDQRHTLAQLSKFTNVSSSTLHRRMGQGGLVKKGDHYQVVEPKRIRNENE